MSDAVSQLERRVRQAIDRIGSLSEERAGLEKEASRLRDRVEELEASRVDTTEGATWVAHRRRTLDELRSVLAELRD